MSFAKPPYCERVRRPLVVSSHRCRRTRPMPFIFGFASRDIHSTMLDELGQR